MEPTATTPTEPATATAPAGWHSDPHDPHHRIRHDRIDKPGSVTLRNNGRLHHICIGRVHAGTDVIMLINDLDIRVIATTTATTNPPVARPDRHPKNNKNQTH